MFSRVKEAQPLYMTVFLGNFYLAVNVCESVLRRLIFKKSSDDLDRDYANLNWLDMAPPLVAFLMVCMMLTVQARNHSAKALALYGIVAVAVDVAPKYTIEAVTAEYKFKKNQRLLY